MCDVVVAMAPLETPVRQFWDLGAVRRGEAAARSHAAQPPAAEAGEADVQEKERGEQARALCMHEVVNDGKFGDILACSAGWPW